MLNLSDCCFGVYIFQQFILMLLERTELAQNVSPYISLDNILSDIVSLFSTNGRNKKNENRFSIIIIYTIDIRIK